MVGAGDRLRRDLRAVTRLGGARPSAEKALVFPLPRTTNALPSSLSPSLNYARSYTLAAQRNVVIKGDGVAHDSEPAKVLTM